MAFAWPKITEQERKAPTGKFRAVAIDTSQLPQIGSIYLMGDYDSVEVAIERAKSLDEPFMGGSVADDTGKICFPEDTNYRVPN